MIKKNAADIAKGLDRCKYLLLVYDFIFTNFSACPSNATTTKKEFQEEMRELEKETAHYISEFITIFLKDLFGELIDFINQNLKEENLSAMKSIGEDLAEINLNASKISGQNQADHARLV